MIHHGDCIEVMAAMDPESVDAIVTDPPYGLEFMGKEWDRLGGDGWRTGGGFSKPGIGDRPTAWTSFGTGDTANATCATCGGRMRGARKCACSEPDWRVKGKALDGAGADSRTAQGRKMQAWHQRWAEVAYRVAKPSAYLLAFGGTRTVHRMTVALEDAGWIIRDMLVWGYASGFPKSKASLKPAWEPIVMARKPGPLRMLAIDECRIAAPENVGRTWTRGGKQEGASLRTNTTGENEYVDANPLGRWPANIVLTDPIFDGGIAGVVGGTSEQSGGGNPANRYTQNGNGVTMGDGWATGPTGAVPVDTEGTYSRFFLVPKSSRSDREPVLGGLPERSDPFAGTAHSKWCEVCGRQAVNVPGAACQCDEPRWTTRAQRTRANVHPTVKPTDLMRHLVRLVTPTGGTVLDPFLGSGTTALAAEMEGFEWIGIEREAEYVAIAEARLNGTQRGLGLAV